MKALPPWRLLLRGAREREGRSAAALWLQLATVAGDGTPRVRTVVFRGWADDAVLDLLTDGERRQFESLVAQFKALREVVQHRLNLPVIPLTTSLLEAP